MVVAVRMNGGSLTFLLDSFSYSFSLPSGPSSHLALGGLK